MRTRFVAGALLYALGQGCTLLFQWLLLQQFGAQGYGEVGLVHLGLVTILFLADLGYAPLFLREDPASADWQAHWRLALYHRLLATLALDLLLLGSVWWAMGSQSEGFGYLLAVLPATLLGLIGYSAPLLAQRRQIPGFLVQQVAMPVAILCWLMVHHGYGWVGGMGSGAAVSVGFLVQAIVNVMAFGGPLRLLFPHRGHGDYRLLSSALQLSLMGIIGVLHDRLTPLLLASVAPAFLPVYLFLSYMLGGVSGMFNQFNRLLLAEAHSDMGREWARGLMSLALGVSALGAQILPLVAEHWGNAVARAWLPWVTPVLASGAVTLFSGVSSALLIGWRRERLLLRLLLWGLLCSGVLQLAAAACAAPQLMLWARLLCLLVMAFLSLRLCSLALNRGGQAALLSALLATATWLGQGGWVLGTVLLFPVVWYAFRHRSLFVQPLAATAEVNMQ